MSHRIRIVGILSVGCRRYSFLAGKHAIWNSNWLHTLFHLSVCCAVLPLAHSVATMFVPPSKGIFFEWDYAESSMHGFYRSCKQSFFFLKKQVFSTSDYRSLGNQENFLRGYFEQYQYSFHYVWIKTYDGRLKAPWPYTVRLIFLKLLKLEICMLFWIQIT